VGEVSHFDGTTHSNHQKTFPVSVFLFGGRSIYAVTTKKENTDCGCRMKNGKEKKKEGKKKKKKALTMSSSGVNHLSDFHEWLQQKREAKVPFLPWVRTMLGDETIMGMKWDDFIGKPRPNRPGKKLDAFNALFQAFSKARGTAEAGLQGTETVQEEQGQGQGQDELAVGNLTVAFEESFSLQPAQEEEDDRPVTPPPRREYTEAPPSSKMAEEPFVIEERKELLSVVSWNTHSFRFMNRQDQRLGMTRVLSSYDLVLLQEIPCGEKARESLEHFCSILDLGGNNPFDLLHRPSRPHHSTPSYSGALNGMWYRLSHCFITYIPQWLRC
jgi:hypothetical protein